MADSPGGDERQRKRIAVACQRCRKRKIRCSGDPGMGQQCTNCKNAGNENCLFLRVASTQAEMKNEPDGFDYAASDSRTYAALHRAQNANYAQYGSTSASGVAGSDLIYRGGYPPYTALPTVPSIPASYGASYSDYDGEYGLNGAAQSMMQQQQDGSMMMQYGSANGWSGGAVPPGPGMTRKPIMVSTTYVDPETGAAYAYSSGSAAAGTSLAHRSASSSSANDASHGGPHVDALGLTTLSSVAASTEARLPDPRVSMSTRQPLPSDKPSASSALIKASIALRTVSSSGSSTANPNSPVDYASLATSPFESMSGPSLPSAPTVPSHGPPLVSISARTPVPSRFTPNIESQTAVANSLLPLGPAKYDTSAYRGPQRGILIMPDDNDDLGGDDGPSYVYGSERRGSEVSSTASFRSSSGSTTSSAAAFPAEQPYVPSNNSQSSSTLHGHTGLHGRVYSSASKMGYPSAEVAMAGGRAARR